MKVLVVFLLGYDMTSTVEYNSYLDTELRSLESSGKIGIGLEVDDILHEDITFHMAPDVATLGENLALDVGGLSDYQLALCVDCAFKSTVDADVGTGSHDTSYLGALGYPAQLIGLGDYFCFCHDIMGFTVVY